MFVDAVCFVLFKAHPVFIHSHVNTHPQGIAIQCMYHIGSNYRSSKKIFFFRNNVRKLILYGTVYMGVIKEGVMKEGVLTEAGPIIRTN